MGWRRLWRPAGNLAAAIFAGIAAHLIDVWSATLPALFAPVAYCSAEAVSAGALLISVADDVAPRCNTMLAPRMPRTIIARTAELIHVSSAALARLSREPTGSRNTTKCDSEKLTKKLAPMTGTSAQFRPNRGTT